MVRGLDKVDQLLTLTMAATTSPDCAPWPNCIRRLRNEHRDGRNGRENCTQSPRIGQIEPACVATTYWMTDMANSGWQGRFDGLVFQRPVSHQQTRLVMKLSHASGSSFANWLRGVGVADQAAKQGWQVEPIIEPVGECTEVAAGVLAELERLVPAIVYRIQIAQHGVDPDELRQLTRFAITEDDVGVCAARVDDTGEATPAITAHIAAGQQLGASPAGDGHTVEAGHCRKLDAHGVAAVVGGDGSNHRHLGWIGTAHGARVLAAKAGIVDLHAAGQRLRGIMLGHDGDIRL